MLIEYDGEKTSECCSPNFKDEVTLINSVLCKMEIEWGTYGAKFVQNLKKKPRCKFSAQKK